MKNYLFLLAFTMILSACRNEKKTKVEADKKEVTKLDSLTCSYDSVVVYSKNVVNGANNDSNTTKAIITYPVFKDEQLNILIRRRVTDYISDGAPNITYKDIATSFVSGYDDYFAADKETSETWSLMIDISVLNQTSNYIGLEYVDSDYSGGAHPNTNSYFINYNPQTKLPITFDSLIDASNRTKLVSIAEAIFRKDEQLKATDALDGKYFF